MKDNIVKFKVVDSNKDLDVSQEILNLIYKIHQEQPMSYGRIIGELEIVKHSLLKSCFDE
jgi:hypothetical protein